MSSLNFQCFMCGKCCHEVPGSDDDPTYKRIPLYPEEADRLEKIAKERDIEIHLIEDVVFPDVKNSKILILTWRIMLDNENKVCPFHDEGKGCTIQDKKPLACLAYPLALQTVDAFNMKIQIDPLCKFTEMHYDELKIIDAKKLQEIYAEEFKHARNMLNRNKRAILHLKILERENRIEIPKKIDNQDFDSHLKKWDRVELDSLDIDNTDYFKEET